MSDGPIDVRRCEAADIALIAAREPPGKNYAPVTHRRQTAGECAYLVAWLDGEPIGSGEVEWSAPPELKNLRVEPEHRGQGIGTAIIRAAERQARSTGGLAIGVDLDNPDARRLYERLGFRPTGRMATYSYSYVDDSGIRHEATETSEYLEKKL